MGPAPGRPTPAPFDPDAWPDRLNLGCGYDLRPGYLNIDFQEYHAPDLVADVRDLSMLPAGRYDEIVAQDVLEHLTRADGPVALREWARVLRPGGRLLLRVPNVLGLAYIMTCRHSVEGQAELVQCLFGTQAYEGDFHQNGYTELLLRHELREAGFGEADFLPFHEWLFDVTAIKGPATGEITFEDCAYMTTEPPSEVLRRLTTPVEPVPAQPAEPEPAPPAFGARASARRLARAARKRLARSR